jgi:hypothetical protein
MSDTQTPGMLDVYTVGTTEETYAVLTLDEVMDAVRADIVNSVDADESAIITVSRDKMTRGDFDALPEM